MGTAVINTTTTALINTHTHGLVVGLAPATLRTLEFWVRFPNERNQGKQGATLCSSTGFLTGPTIPLAPREQLYIIIGTAVINTLISTK